MASRKDLLLILSFDLSMHASQFPGTVISFFLASLLMGLPLQAEANTGTAATVSTSTVPSNLSVCEDFAQRQIELADRQLQQSSYTRALKVLNSTAKNCDIEPVREKIVEVFDEWFAVVQTQGASTLQQFIRVLSDQSYLSSQQKSQFEQRIETQVQSLIEDEYSDENFQATYRLCRSHADHASESFDVEYYCGTAADELNADRVAINSYEWLIENWSDDQSLTTWNELTDTLEGLYFANGDFRDAYALARTTAQRETTPEKILTSLLSARGDLLSPVLKAGSEFYSGQASQPAKTYVENEMQRVSFPKYVKAFYILTADGEVERGMYGSEANEPNLSKLENVTDAPSLLQSSGDTNLAWLVSPLNSRYLVLEFGLETTSDENVQLETIYENVGRDEHWEKLYDIVFEEMSPPVGSAVATFLGGMSISGNNLSSYARLFDDSPLLSYYCIQTGDAEIDASHNFNRNNLNYGDSEWQRTSNTPALYHHSVEYSDQSVREVVWPKFVDEEWTGVVRVGLTPS